MFCRKCGEQLPDDAKFCRKCGTLVQLPEGWQGQAGQTVQTGEPGPSHTEPSPVRPVKRTPAQRMRLIAAVAAAVLILLGALAGAVYGITPAQRARRQVTLGDRYLEQMEYERAIAAYEKAIAIDPNNTAAYKGLNTSVESYATMVSSEGESVDREQARKVADAYKRLEDVIRDAEERDIDTGIPEERKDEITDGREKFERIADGEDPEGQDPNDGEGIPGEGQDGANSGEDGARRVDYAPYEKILELYREGSRKYAGDSNAALDAYLDNADPMLNAFAFYAESFGMRLIYALYDIDGNGIRELLVSETGGDVELGEPTLSPNPFAVYTLDRNGTVYPLIRDITERMQSIVYRDGTIYIYGSNGAASGIADFYRFEEEGPETGVALYLEDEITVDFERDPYNAYFRGEEQMNQEEFDAQYTQRPEIDATWVYLETPVTEYVETVFGTEEAFDYTRIDETVSSAVIYLCVEKDISLWSGFTDMQNDFWRLLCFYCNFSPDIYRQHFPRIGEYGEYEDIPDSVLCGIAYSFFPEFDGTLPPVDGSNAIEGTTDQRTGIGIGDTCPVRLEKKDAQENPDGSVDVVYAVSYYSDGYIADYYVHYVPAAEHTGQEAAFASAYVVESAGIY